MSHLVHDTQTTLEASILTTAWPISKKVFQDECAFAGFEVCSAAETFHGRIAADVRCLGANEPIFGVTVRAIEQRGFVWHSRSLEPEFVSLN
jgi:hypothetical protein